MKPRIADIRVYPVKSMRGFSTPHRAVEPQGLADDRSWIAADAQGRMITQRENAALARISARLIEGGLELEVAGREALRVATPEPDAPEAEVSVWRSLVPAREAVGARAWLSDALGVPARLLHQHDPQSRAVNPAFGKPEDRVSFADGYPILIAGTASLEDLNRRLPAPVGMERFRPNIVVSGLNPWEEDEWRLIRIRDLTLRIVKPCGRCVMTTMDQATGARDADTQPLRTLASFRRGVRGEIMFGQNVTPDGAGEVALGDEVIVVERGRTNIFG